MKVRYAPTAFSELQEIAAYISARSPSGARNVLHRIERVIELLESHPDAGTRTDDPGIRRLVTVPYPYSILYEVIDDEVVIVSVRHGARRSGPAHSDD